MGYGKDWVGLVGLEEMRLPNNDPRCSGGNGKDEICPQRESCERYLQRANNGPWGVCSNFYRPDELIGCMEKIEADK